MGGTEVSGGTETEPASRWCDFMCTLVHKAALIGPVGSRVACMNVY